MDPASIIGIDPDSKKFVCYLMKSDGKNNVKKEYSLSSSDINEFLSWTKSLKNVHIAVEGKNGQSGTLEKAFNKENINFFSLPSYRVNKFRKSVLGENKNNWIDAEAVARFALTLQVQSKLEVFKHKTQEALNHLRLITREYDRLVKHQTRDINTLWKYVREASADLYLALQGKNPETDITINMLNRSGILCLLSAKPNLDEWKSMKYEDFLEVMGHGKHYKGYAPVIHDLMKISEYFTETPFMLSLAIQQTAQRLLLIKKQVKQISAELAKAGSENESVSALMRYKGIGPIHASRIISEIRDINRFASNDKLASYSGIGMIEEKTGDSERMKKCTMFNRRLKDAFIQGGMSVVYHNPDSHLRGYYNSLVRRGVKHMNAQRRVARAFIRRVYRDLKKVAAECKTKAGEDSVADGMYPSVKRNTPSSPVKKSRIRGMQKQGGSR